MLRGGALKSGARGPQCEAANVLAQRRAVGGGVEEVEEEKAAGAHGWQHDNFL